MGGLSVTRATDGLGNNSADANKRYVDAQIDLSPLTDTNGITENHTITATVQQDDGFAAGAPGDAVTGFGPAPTGTLVTFSFATNTIGAVFVGGTNTCTTSAAGTCSIQIVSSTAGTVTVHATTTFTIPAAGSSPSEEVTRATGTGGLNSADAQKTFVAGTLTWIKNGNDGNRLGGATFQVCRTHTLNSNTGVQVDTADVCSSPNIADTTSGTPGASNGINGPDQDADPGEFQLTNLVLGRYTVKETIAPAGWAADPDTETADDMTIADPNATITLAFVNNRPILKISGFGYTNVAQSASPTSGIVSGIATYTVNLHNYGLAAATLSNSSIAASVTGAGTGTLTCNGDAPAPALTKALTGAIAANGDLGPVTLVCTYTGMADGAKIKATLNVNYTTAGTGERAASGSPATIEFTVQGD